MCKLVSGRATKVRVAVSWLSRTLSIDVPIIGDWKLETREIRVSKETHIHTQRRRCSPQGATERLSCHLKRRFGASPKSASCSRPATHHASIAQHIAGNSTSPKKRASPAPSPASGDVSQTRRERAARERVSPRLKGLEAL